jgi:hypothetical protein
MRIQEFQIALVNQTRKQLPRKLKNFEPRSFFTIVKLSYANPKIHYEVWVRGQEHLVEVGLHFEADKETNDALREHFDARAFEIRAALGTRVEVEQWTNSWSRVHEVMPYTKLNAELVESVAKKLAKMITVLQPMLEEFEKS